MDLTQRSEGFVTDDQSWLGSAHATDTADTVTLDVTTFDLTPGGDFPDGFIPSGVVVAKITATGKYGPYDEAANDGREDETTARLLLNAVRAKDGDTGDKVAAVIWHGQVIVANLPTNNGLTAAARAAGLKHIDFID